VLAEQVRSGLVETVHDGAVAVSNRRGDLVAWSGEIDRPFYFRSAAKPFQAAVSQAAGAGLGPEQLAMACASHDGEAVHLALVASMLDEVGLSEEHLGCPPDWPIRPEAGRRLAASGVSGPSRIFHNCSGKHAAMLRACLASNWPLADYLQPQHPLQQRILQFMTEIAGVAPRVGVDGCGVPVFETTARGMSMAFARLAVDQGLASVFGSMHSYPGLVSGVGNADAAIARHLHAAAKRGALGALGVSLGSGLGVAVKCWDGSERPAAMAAIATLDALGAVPPPAQEPLERFRRPPVRGGGRVVGHLVSRLVLQWA
jgi:L-asparaginase II